MNLALDLACLFIRVIRAIRVHLKKIRFISVIRVLFIITLVVSRLNHLFAFLSHEVPLTIPHT